MEMVKEKEKKKTFSVPDGCAIVVKNEGEREREKEGGGGVGKWEIFRPSDWCEPPVACSAHETDIIARFERSRNNNTQGIKG